MFGGADQIEVLTLYLVHHGVHLGLAHDSLDDVAVYHEGGYAVSEALVYHEIPGIGQNGAVKSRDVSGQVIETVARDSSGSVHVYSVERFHYLRMVGNLEIRDCGLAESLYLDVAAVIRPDGDGGVYHIWDLQHYSADFFGQLGL